MVMDQGVESNFCFVSVFIDSKHHNHGSSDPCKKSISVFELHIVCFESVMKYSGDKAENIFAIGTLSLTDRQIYVIFGFH